MRLGRSRLCAHVSQACRRDCRRLVLRARRGVVGGAVPAGSVADRRSEDAGGPHGGRGWQRLQGEACELSGGDLVLDECEHGLAEAGWVVQRCFPGAGGLVLALEQLHPVRAQWVLAGLS